MNNPLYFFVEMLHQPTSVVIWVNWLVLINVVSVLFWRQREARVVFFTQLGSALLMMGLYAMFGYERILGLGHVLWIPLVVYLLVRMGEVTESRFRAYLWTLVVSNVISLVLDVRDVWLYVTG